MRTWPWVVLVLLGAGCRERPIEAGMRVGMLVDHTTTSKCFKLFARGGGLELSTPGTALDPSIDRWEIGVAQGKLPDDITLEATGYSDVGCTVENDPLEGTGLASATFLQSHVIDVTLKFRRVSPDTEKSRCDNGLDDDHDGLTDCADPDCEGYRCASENACVVNKTCNLGQCAGGEAVTCTTPPSVCFDPPGICVQGADGGCRYTPHAGRSCDDQDPCTTNDACQLDGTCKGTDVTCSSAPTSCFANPGKCDRTLAACVYQADPGIACTDGDSCTVGDLCLTDGGCGGTRVSCPASDCAQPTGFCGADGGCDYAWLDAGAPCPSGVCNGSGACIPSFPYPPSNFTEAQLAPPPAGKVVLNCGETLIDTGTTGAPSVTNWCAGQPTFGWSWLTQAGGPELVVLSFSALDVGADGGLKIVGQRPVALAVTGNVNVLGSIVAEAGASACVAGGAGGAGASASSNGGGGGGAFGSAGASGGAGGTVFVGTAGTAGAGSAVSGGASLVPLRGGCPGGVGGDATAAAAGGGGFQLSAGGDLVVIGTIAAPGQGGAGGASQAFKGKGGGGGGSGGGVLLEARSFTLVGTGAVTANGGSGGQGGSGVATGDDGVTSMSAAAASGAAGSAFAGGAGGDGAAQGTGSKPGLGAAALSGAGGGGGGGGLGRIRINVATLCSLSNLGTLSPTPTSGEADAGCP